MDDISFPFIEQAYLYPPEKRPLARFGQKAKPDKHAPKRKGVSISAAHHQQLVLLAGLPKLAGVGLGDLLDNILTVFSEDYAPEIQSELELLQYRFPRTDTPPA